MAAPESTEEILRSFLDVIREEGPRNVSLKPDARALLKRFLTHGAQQIMDAKPDEREEIFQQSLIDLRRVVRAASARADAIRTERMSTFMTLDDDRRADPVMTINGREASRLLADFGPVPPFC